MSSSLSLKQLAEMLHLAPSTVSRALKGHPDISEETQKRVRELALRLHYRPDAVALSLRNKRSFIVAVVVPRLIEDYYARVVSSIVHIAFSSGYRIMLFESEDQAGKEADICCFLRKSGIEGVIIALAKDTSSIEHLKQLREEGIPVVVFGNSVGHPDLDRVIEDDYESAYAVVNHMLRGGCRNLVHLAGSRYWLWAQKRAMGFTQALTDRRMPVTEESIVPYGEVDKVEEITASLMQQRELDGIFAVNDEVAMEVLRTLHRLKCKVPEEIAVSGFGNISATRLGCPSLTTVDRHEQRVGEKAVGLLIKRIEGKSANERETCLIKNRLLIRESTLSVCITD